MGISSLVYRVVYNALLVWILIVVSKKLTSVVLASCVNLMVLCILFKYSTNFWS